MTTISTNVTFLKTFLSGNQFDSLALRGTTQSPSHREPPSKSSSPTWPVRVFFHRSSQPHFLHDGFFRSHWSSCSRPVGKWIQPSVQNGSMIASRDPGDKKLIKKKKSRKTTQQQKIKKNFEDQITADIVIKVRGVRNSCTGLLFTSPHGRGAPM